MPGRFFRAKSAEIQKKSERIRSEIKELKRIHKEKIQREKELKKPKL